MSEIVKHVAPWLKFAVLALVVTVLYLGQAVLVPLALAGLLTFLLTPVVAFLQRYLGRIAAVLLSVVLTFAVVGVIAWGLATELHGLAHELPGYRHGIRQRIADLRGVSRGGAVEKVQDAVKDIKEAIQGEEVAGTRADKPAVAPGSAPSEWTDISTALGPLLGSLATGGLVVVLAIFMLLERQELRNRLIRLVGFAQVGRTTVALDEAGSRISRYLLMQSIVNGLFGLGVGIGLWLLGLPHALLWGCLAAALRFVPYVGPWIAALAPIALGLAVFPGWTRPLLVVALFVVLELFTNLVLETFLYADAAGVSEVGLLVAIAFWTWIWGPAGLLMATPLTVCLVVLGKYVPGMQFLTTLLGDAPALVPHVAYYQRLLANDRDEASEILETHLATAGPVNVFDAVMLPALNYALRDAPELSARQEQDVLAGTVALLDDVVTSPSATGPPAADPPVSRPPVVVIGCPARGEADEVALRMLAALLDPTLFTVEATSSRLLVSEVVSLVKARPGAAVCIGALPPGGTAHARILCKRLRAELPDLKILVGRWGPAELGGEGAEALRAAGADLVGATLAESRDQLYQLVTLLGGGPGAAPDARAAADARTDGAAGSRTSRPGALSVPDPSSART
jgi:predicted PurR-regulated permease PerM